MLWLQDMSHDPMPPSLLLTRLTRICIFKMADEREFYVCQCFFTHNIFLKNYEAHVVFENEEQFQYDYRRVCMDFCILKLAWGRDLEI